MARNAVLLPVADAARELGVSQQRVRAMIAAGEMAAEKAAGAWWISPSAVARISRAQRDSGRPLASASAWALLLAASGVPIPWASAQQRWRVSSALDEGSLESSFGKLRRRAERREFQAHPGELARMRKRRELMLGGVSASGELRLGLRGDEEFEAYVAESDLEAVVRRHGLAGGGEMNVVLRAVPDQLWGSVADVVAPLAAVLADLAEHPDPRARRVARDRARQLDRERRAGG